MSLDLDDEDDVDVVDVWRLIKRSKDVFTHRGFSSRESDLVDALRGKEIRDTDNLIQSEDVVRGRKRNTLLGHAVLASEVALFRETDPEVCVIPPKRVCEQLSLRDLLDVGIFFELLPVDSLSFMPLCWDETHASYLLDKLL